MDNIKVKKPQPVKASQAQSLGLPSTLMPVKNVGWGFLRWPWEKHRLERALESAQKTLEAIS